MRARTLCVLSVVAVSLALAASAQADYVSVVAADSPVSWYRMQETNPVEGSTAVDSGSLGRNGTYSGGVVNLAASMASSVSPAKEFGASSAKVVVPALGSSILTSVFAIEFMMNPTSYPEDETMNTVLATQGWGPYDVDLNIYHGGIALAFSDGGWPWGRLDVTGLAPAGEWSHVVATYEGVEGVGGTTKYYINGNLEGTADVGYVQVDFGQLANIGWNPDNGRPFVGGLDEVAVYNYSLTDVQVQTHYNAIVPEPRTVALLVTGLLGLLAYAWRKRK